MTNHAKISNKRSRLICDLEKKVSEEWILYKGKTKEEWDKMFSDIIAFIETQIALAEKRWRWEMKKKCVKTIAENLESEKYSKSYYVYWLKVARNSISSLPTNEK